MSATNGTHSARGLRPRRRRRGRCRPVRSSLRGRRRTGPRAREGAASSRRRARWRRAGSRPRSATTTRPRSTPRTRLRTGRGLSRPSAVAALTGEAPARIRDLVELGVEFDDDLGLEGGHGRRRVVHAGGAATGDRVARVLVERVLAHPRIEVAEGERMQELWRSGDRCLGVVTDRRAIRSRATLLATGGAAALWSRTTNPPGAVGDGIAAAYRAGAAVADLEFVQFHPTTLVDSTLLLSEALRGEGALLLDDCGERFTDELAPRDVVARDIAARGTALLDLREIDRARFPSLMGSLAERRLRPCRDADSRRSGGALHGRRDRDRPRRPQRASRPLRGGRVCRDRCPRREPAGVELAPRVPRLRPPGGARRARRARPFRTCLRARSRARSRV